MIKLKYTGLISLLVFVILLFQGCEKELDQHPKLQTLDFIAISPTKVKVKGNIVSVGDFDVSDYGFVYGVNPNVDITSGTRVSLGKDVSEGEINQEIGNITVSNSYYYNTLYIRMYLTNKNGTAYGQVLSVQLPSISTSSLYPNSGKVGDLITINGNFYTSNKDEVTVTFNNVKATVTETTPSKIIVQVPSGVNGTYDVQVAVTIGSQKITTSSYFAMKPYITDFNPKSGPVGTVVTFTGHNISTSYYSNYKAMFGQTESYLYGSNYPYYTSAQTSIPLNVGQSELPVSVIIDGVTTNFPDKFIVTPPVIEAISTTKGLYGSLVTLTCSNLPSNSQVNNNAIKIGDNPVSLYSINGNQLSFYIPTTIEEGEQSVSLTVGPHTVYAPQKLTVKQHTVSGFSPSSGGIGKEVTISGEFVPNQWYNVYFGSYTASSVSSSSGSLKVVVPYAAQEGDVKVSVEYGDKKITAPGTFKILAPAITSFSPTSGVPGTVVTISGVGFYPSNYSYYTTVKFGTVATEVISANESTIKVVVPSNVNPGAMKITVASNGQTIVSPSNFTVTN
ncbi:IPT/TIG domain-containing protein [Solitalea sp. MAHUQ-68]|uniref:IPT/TIG domain-containing protein n=1 Tax=Solitalea agri TaxID=2953739 RepID=A0A9X2FBL8_9SPHI|nr:IPT/TIG domain-containing protein [Solitalea agri]MCO4293908.1 IPT/TIG domain-containing protein [Solitalea agri]